MDSEGAAALLRLAALGQRRPIEEISRLVGHRSTLVTETVYRKQLRPIIPSGATVMDRLFASNGSRFGGQEPLKTKKPGPSK